METNNHINQSFARKVKAMQRMPAVGKGTAVTRVSLDDGLACTVEEGPWKLVADMSPKSGGQGHGPTPGTYGRAALGSCLAISYAMWASMLDIPINHLEIEVQADYDARGMYGWKEVPPDYSELRYLVRIESPASRESVMQLLDMAELHSSYLHVFRKPQSVKRSVEILTSTTI